MPKRPACRAHEQALYDGESYEVCLTTMLSREPAPDPRRLYTILRAVNPAPYAAWLHFGGGGPQVRRRVWVCT